MKAAISLRGEVTLRIWNREFSSFEQPFKAALYSFRVDSFFFFFYPGEQVAIGERYVDFSHKVDPLKESLIDTSVLREAPCACDLSITAIIGTAFPFSGARRDGRAAFEERDLERRRNVHAG